MKKINGKKISLCSNAQDRMRRFACLQDCLLTLTCHLASQSSQYPSNRPYLHLFAPNCSHSSIRDSVTPLLVVFRIVLRHVCLLCIGNTDKSRGSQRKHSYGDKTEKYYISIIFFFSHTGRNLTRVRTTGGSQAPRVVRTLAKLCPVCEKKK